MFVFTNSKSKFLQLLLLFFLVFLTNACSGGSSSNGGGGDGDGSFTECSDGFGDASRCETREGL